MNNLKNRFFLYIFLTCLLNPICGEVAASSAVETPANPYSHPSATKYQTYQWDPTRVHHVMWEALKDCEGQAFGQTEYLDKPGNESFAVLVGTNYVARLRKGLNLCEELDNVNSVVKTFLERKIDFSNDGLTICLPVRCFFLTPSDGSDEYANLFILPKVKGYSLALSLFQESKSDYFGEILWSVGRTLGLFHMTFMENHGTHVTTAKHDDMSLGNIFYERRNLAGKDQWTISWIDCTHMYLKNEGPLTEIGHLIANIEHRLLEASVHLSQISFFQQKILEGYCSSLSQNIIRILHGLLGNSQSFANEEWLLGIKISIMRHSATPVSADNILKLIHQFFGRYLESQQKAAEEAKAGEAQSTTTPATPSAPAPATPPVAEQQEAAISQTHSDAENIPPSTEQDAALALTEQEEESIQTTPSTPPVVEQQEVVCSQAHSDAENTPSSAGQDAALALTEPADSEASDSETEK